MATLDADYDQREKTARDAIELLLGDYACRQIKVCTKVHVSLDYDGHSFQAVANTRAEAMADLLREVAASGARQRR